MLTLLYVALDPQHGVKCMRGRTLRSKNEEAQIQLRNEKGDAAVLQAQILLVWRWADVMEDGQLGPTELRRLADHVGDADFDAERNYQTICEALGLALESAIGRDAFVSACCAHEPDPSPYALGSGERPIVDWFDRLQLKLEL